MNDDTIPASIKRVAMAHCHEVVACPHCGAEVGTRCFQTYMRARTGLWVDRRHSRQDEYGLRPHRARWIQLVPGSARAA